MIRRVEPISPIFPTRDSKSKQEENRKFRQQVKKSATSNTKEKSFETILKEKQESLGAKKGQDKER